MPSRSVKEMFYSTLNRPEATDTPDGEAGQGMVEYGLMVGLVAILVISVFVVLGPMIRDLLKDPVSGEEQSDQKAAISSAVYQ